jgi:hypothetical protein
MKMDWRGAGKAMVDGGGRGHDWRSARIGRWKTTRDLHID